MSKKRVFFEKYALIAALIRVINANMNCDQLTGIAKSSGRSLTEIGSDEIISNVSNLIKNWLKVTGDINNIEARFKNVLYREFEDKIFKNKTININMVLKNAQELFLEGEEYFNCFGHKVEPSDIIFEEKIKDTIIDPEDYMVILIFLQRCTMNPKIA